VSAVLSRPVLRYDNMTLLVLKLTAFLVMILDHVDLFFSGGHGFHAGMGRLVFPVFGCLLAYNMARTDAGKLLRSVAPRLLLLGLGSQGFYAVLQGAWVPLNILFTLAAASAVYALCERSAWWLALGVLVWSGFWVDYGWWGVAGVVLLAQAFRSGEVWRVWLALVGFCLALTLTNGNTYALIAAPLLLLALLWRSGDAPRYKWLFLAGYPVHLAALVVVKLL
jgi:hypothetical protein